MRWALLTICGGLVVAGAVVATAATSPRKLAAQPGMAMTGDKAAPGYWLTAAALCGLCATCILYGAVGRKHEAEPEAVALRRRPTVR